MLEGPQGLFVGPLVENSRGERAGLRTGQRVLEVNGAGVDDLDELAAAVRDSPGGTVSFLVEEPGGAATSSVEVDLGSAVSTTEPAAFLGVGADYTLQPEPLPEHWSRRSASSRRAWKRASRASPRCSTLRGSSDSSATPSPAASRT
ncbi:MAG: PDZ domain-containing protein [Microthrixaceae bacterium]